MTDDTRCAVAGCGRVLHGDGYCKPHHRRWRRHGDPRADVPISYRTSMGHVSYVAVAARVRAAHGRADAHACTDCSRAAACWGYDHSDPDELADPTTGRVYSTDPGRYRPLCRSCQRRADWQRRGGRGPLDPETCARLYRDGCSVRGIARRFGYGRQAVTDALRAADVTIRPPGRHRHR